MIGRSTTVDRFNPQLNFHNSNTAWRDKMALT